MADQITQPVEKPPVEKLAAEKSTAEKLTAEQLNAEKVAAGKMTDRAENAAAAMSKSAEHMAENGAEFSLKLIALAELNMHEAFQAMRAASAAKDVSEVMRIQTEFLRDQGTRSIEQVREISELIAGYGRNAMSRITEHAA